MWLIPIYRLGQNRWDTSDSYSMHKNTFWQTSSQDLSNCQDIIIWYNNYMYLQISTILLWKLPLFWNIGKIIPSVLAKPVLWPWTVIYTRHPHILEICFCYLKSVIRSLSSKKNMTLNIQLVYICKTLGRKITNNLGAIHFMKETVTLVSVFKWTLPSIFGYHLLPKFINKIWSKWRHVCIKISYVKKLRAV